MIDPAKLNPKHVEAAINERTPTLNSANREIAAYLNALLSDDEAMERALKTLLAHPDSTRKFNDVWKEKMRVAFLAAIEEARRSKVALDSARPKRRA